MAAESQTTGINVTTGRSARQKQAILILSRVWAWVFLTGLIIFFATSISISSNGAINFLNLRNSQNVLVAIVPILLMGLGQTFVIIGGGIDLSVGWIMGLSSVISALVISTLVNTNHTPEVPAIAIGFAAGIACGVIPGIINGVIISKLRIPSFIVTLGMSFIVRGIAFLLSGGNSVIGQPVGVRNFGNESLLYLVSGDGGGLYFFQKPNITGDALQQLDRIFAWPVVVAFLVVALIMFILHRTQFGRHTYAIGGNQEAARRAGVPVDLRVIEIFALSGLTTGIAGVLNTARYNAGSPIAGDPLLLSSIAAVIIGGVSMFGGSGNIIGTVIGSLIIAILTTGLVMLSVQSFWQFIVVGVVVILAVLIDQLRDLVVGRAEST